MARFFRKRPVDELIEKQRAELKSEPDILRSAALTGLAAFGGALMNWNYVMAHSVPAALLLYSKLPPRPSPAACAPPPNSARTAAVAACRLL